MVNKELFSRERFKIDPLRDIAVAETFHPMMIRQVYSLQPIPKNEALAHNLNAVVGYNVQDWMKGRRMARQIHGAEADLRSCRTSEDQQLAITFRKSKSKGFSGRRIMAPDPHGMSGGPVFAYAPTISRDILAAVATDYIVKDNSIRGTTVAHLARFIENGFFVD